MPRDVENERLEAIAPLEKEREKKRLELIKKLPKKESVDFFTGDLVTNRTPNDDSQIPIYVKPGELINPDQSIERYTKSAKMAKKGPNLLGM